MRVLIVAEYYPRAHDPVNGIWAHRQALAAREAGADVRVVVLHRPIPPLAVVRARDVRTALAVIRQPARGCVHGLAVEYVRYLSPPRQWSYSSWGAWAAPFIKRALSNVRRTFPFELVHAHYAVPAGDAVRRAAAAVPLVVSVHGHDVHGVGAGGSAVRATLAHARLVIANSAGTAARCSRYGARATRVVHLGADLPGSASPLPDVPTLVTVGNLISRKRHADVIRALKLLRDRGRAPRYVIVGDGPERGRLQILATSLQLDDLVEFRGRLAHDEAVATAQAASLFVLPSVDEAFGVAYVEAMAGGVPAIGCRGEDGPEEIAAGGAGIALVPRGDPASLADQIDSLLQNRRELEMMGRDARNTVQRGFTWQQCGAETVAAYREVAGLVDK